MDLRIDTPPETKPWIERLARLGYAAKGVVYILVGWLAAGAARGIEDLPDGSREAYLAVLEKPFGRLLLAVIALGLIGYTLWRIVAAVADPERKGSDAKGLAVRAYYLGSAVVHGTLAAGAVRLVMDGGASGGGGGDEMPARTATLMAQPFGRFLVAAVGIGFLVAAVHQARLALGRYRKKLKPYHLPEWAQPAVGPVVGFGLMARGLVFAIVGGFLVLAAWRARPEEAKGLAGALGAVLSQPAGPWLLGLVAAGLAAYGVFNLLMARYRSIRP